MVLGHIFTSCKSSYSEKKKILQRFRIDLKDIKFPINIRDTHKIEERKNCISIGTFGYKKKEKYQIYVSNNTFKRHVHLLFIAEEEKTHYILIRDFSTFI